MSGIDLPQPAAALDRALVDALDAAAAQDADGLARGLDRLAAHRPEQVRRLLADCLRPALERRHADGVDGDDLLQLAQEVVEAFPEQSVDLLAVAVVLTGAFGITVTHPDPDATVDSPPPATLVRHAVLITAHVAPRRRDVRALLDAAWSEIARSDTQDG